MEKIRWELKKISKKILILLLLVVSLCGTSIHHSYALENYTGPFVKVKKIDYPSWWTEKIPEIKSWSTWMCQYNGQWSYCLESSKKVPTEGTKTAYELVHSNQTVAKILYYGFGGPDDHSHDWFPSSSWNQETAYLYTHILLSYAYSGDVYGVDLDALESLGIGLKGLYQWFEAQPAPQTPQMSDQLVASFDKQTKQQKTNTITFQASEQATAFLTLQKDVTLYNVTRHTQEQGTVMIHGGDQYYLTAPLNVHGSYISNNIAGHNCQKFMPLAIAGNEMIQTHGTYCFDQAHLTYQVNWLDMGELRLSKVNQTSQFQKGAKFKLKSISYEGFEQEYEVTKDQDGDYELLIKNLPIGTYSLTEVSCEDYFAPAVAQFEVTIEKDKTTKQVVVNTLRPTGTLNVKKALAPTDEGVVFIGDQDVTKTYFQIFATEDIYDTVSLKKLYSKGETIALDSGKCIINTKDEQVLEYSQGVQLLKGTAIEKDIFAVDGNGDMSLANLPLGSYEIKEIACPEGYVLDETKHSFTITQKNYTTQVYFEQFELLNKPTVIEIEKVDQHTQQLLAGAKLKLFDQDGNLIDEWITDHSCHRIAGLRVGQTYILHEEQAPENYDLSSDLSFTVKNTTEIQKVKMADQKHVQKIVKTGDETSFSIYFMIASLSLFVLSLIYCLKKKY